MYLPNLEYIKDQLKPRLVEYLESKGVEIDKKSWICKCFNPAHKDDTNPSCSLQKRDHTLFYCFGCQKGGNIFDAVSLLEKDMPTVGPEFISKTVRFLLDHFKLEIEIPQLSEAEEYALRVQKAYSEVTEYIIQAPKSQIVTSELARRQWSDELCKQYGVGTVESYKAFQDLLKQKGYDKEFVRQVDLSRRDMFNENNIIFTIHDERDKVTGFACRRLSGEGSKYLNQSTREIGALTIYRKGEILYGLNNAIVSANIKGIGPIYVVEGYADVLTARQHGLDLVVAICGTELRDHQVTLLKRHGFSNIVLCLDGDATGQDRGAKILDEVSKGHRDLTISLVCLPSNEDPDSFIREQGIDEFLKLKKWDAFDWRLATFFKEADEITSKSYDLDQEENGEERARIADEICQALLPLIVSEPSVLKQERMIKKLSDRIAVPIQTLYKEVERLENEKDIRKKQDREVILHKLIKNLQRDPHEAEIYLAEAQSNLFEIMREYQADKLSIESYIDFLMEQKILQESKSDAFSGFILGEDLENLQNALNGEWKRDVAILIGGDANSGKSSFCAKLAYEIANHKEDNNACVIYHSIDDSAEQLLPKFICIGEGSRTLKINQVSNPNYYYRIKQEAIRDKREYGYNNIIDMARRGRLVLKDINAGNSLPSIEMLIRFYKEKYPKRNLVYILDNFHKLKEFSSSDVDRLMFKAASSLTKELATRYHITMICTVEYRKVDNGIKPSNRHISETKQLDYDANLIIHLYNEMHEIGERASNFFISVDEYGNKIKLPRIEAIFGKNKITDFKGTLHFNFFPASSDFEGISELEFQEKEEDNKNNNNDDNDMETMYD